MIGIRAAPSGFLRGQVRLQSIPLFVGQISSYHPISVPASALCKHALAIEDRRAAAQLQIKEQRAQEAAIQTYLNVMRDLLLDEGLKASEPGSSVRVVADAQTLATLRRLDGVRKRVVVQFLYESSLIQKDRPIVHLSTAPLEGIDLRRVTLRNINLAGAQLSDAELIDANLYKANLSHADLSEANLYKANLYKANLYKANLSEANLYKANLSGASLQNATLSDTSGITSEELEKQVVTLEDATMPNGQKYEEWLKSKGHAGEDGENTNSP